MPLAFAWFCAMGAVVANVAANVSLKKLATGLKFDGIGPLVTSVLLTPWSWIAGGSCAVLLTLYVLAIRTLPLGVTYITVSSLALAGLTVIDVVTGGKTLDFWWLAGLSFVILGTSMLVFSVSELPR